MSVLLLSAGPAGQGRRSPPLTRAVSLPMRLPRNGGVRIGERHAPAAPARCGPGLAQRGWEGRLPGKKKHKRRAALHATRHALSATMATKKLSRLRGGWSRTWGREMCLCLPIFRPRLSRGWSANGRGTGGPPAGARAPTVVLPSPPYHELPSRSHNSTPNTPS